MGIFGPKTAEVTEKWGKIHNEVVHNLCSSPNITRKINIEKEVAQHRWRMHTSLYDLFHVILYRIYCSTQLCRPTRI